MGDICTLVQQDKNLVDKYGRLLGYFILPDGSVLKEIVIKGGCAKSYNDIFCKMFPLYQEWNLHANSNLKGSYSFSK